MLFLYSCLNARFDKISFLLLLITKIRFFFLHLPRPYMEQPYEWTVKWNFIHKIGRRGRAIYHCQLTQWEELKLNCNSSGTIVHFRLWGPGKNRKSLIPVVITSLKQIFYQPSSFFISEGEKIWRMQTTTWFPSLYPSIFPPRNLER